MNVVERRIETEGGVRLPSLRERERKNSPWRERKKNTSMKSFLAVSHEVLSLSNSYST